MASEDHAWTVQGLVVRGEQRGRLIGYPTANVETPAGVQLPADGVYAGLASGTPGSGIYRAAAISVGTNPTFDGQHRTVEAYLLDFDGDLYDSVLAVRSVRRLRGMLRFAGVSELVSAMARDVQQTRELIAAVDPRAFATVPPQRSRVS
ncbi:riboflavin kinase [Geodermatophilus sp. URMC 64]